MLDDEQKEKMMVMMIFNGENGDVNVTVSGGRGEGAYACPNQSAHQLPNKTERYISDMYVSFYLTILPRSQSLHLIHPRDGLGLRQSHGTLSLFLSLVDRLTPQTS